MLKYEIDPQQFKAAIDNTIQLPDFEHNGEIYQIISYPLAMDGDSYPVAYSVFKNSDRTWYTCFKMAVAGRVWGRLEHGPQLFLLHSEKAHKKLHSMIVEATTNYVDGDFERTYMFTDKDFPPQKIEWVI